MPRSVQGREAAQIQGALIVANYQQAIYTHPGVATNDHVAFADASIRYIAIPPIRTPAGQYSNHLALEGVPQAVELYRDQEYFIAFGSTVSSQSGAWIPGGAVKLISLNPGHAGNTLAFTAVVGTDKLRINWVQI